MRKWSKQRARDRPRLRVKTQAPYVPAEVRRRIVQQLRTVLPPKQEKARHSHYAALLFLVSSNSSGQRMADFSHATWEDFYVRYSDKYKVDLLIIKPASCKQDPLGRQPERWAMVAASKPQDPMMCPIATFRFCREKMDTQTFGPFWRTDRIDAKQAKGLFDKYVSIWRKAVKNLGLPDRINAHSMRASVVTELTELGFRKEFMQELMRWTKSSTMYLGYDRSGQINQEAKISCLKIE